MYGTKLLFSHWLVSSTCNREISLHRVLSDAPQQPPEAVADAWRLVYGILEDLNRFYPGLHLPAAPEERGESNP